MFRKIFPYLIAIIVVSSCIHLARTCKIYVIKKSTIKKSTIDLSKPLTENSIIQTHPARGTVLRYENFRGYEVPIKADGKGGCYRWIADVPWDEFTIEEKFDMARTGGGYLGKKDMKEMWRKYGDLREGDIQ